MDLTTTVQDATPFLKKKRKRKKKGRRRKDDEEEKGWNYEEIGPFIFHQGTRLVLTLIEELAKEAQCHFVSTMRVQ